MARVIRWSIVVLIASCLAGGWPEYGSGTTMPADALASVAPVAAGVVQVSDRTIFLPFAAQHIIPHLERVGQIGGVTRAVAAADPYIYLGSGPRILVVEATEQGEPRVVGQTDVLPGVVQDIEVASGALYVVAAPYAGRSLLILSTAEPTRPVVASTYHAPGEVIDVAISGDRAYVATWHDGLVILDVADPLRPRELGRYVTRRTSVGVVAGRRYIVLSDYDGDPESVTSRFLDVSDPARPVEVITRGAGASSRGTFVGDFFYVPTYTDLTVLAPPDFAPLVHLPDGNGAAIAVDGDYAYITEYGHSEGSALAVIDVTKPGQPRRVDVCEPGVNEPCGRLGSGPLAAAGGWVALVKGQGNQAGMRLVDVRDPRHPKAAGTLDLLGDTYSGVWAADNTVFVTDGSGDQVRTIDVSSPEHPILLGATPGQWRNRLAIRDGYAYRVAFYAGLETDQSTLEVLDVGNPAAPRRVGALTWPDGRQLADIALAGDVLVVVGTIVAPGDSVNGQVFLSTVAVADPARPVEVGEVGPFDGSAIGVAVGDARGYLLTREFLGRPGKGYPISTVRVIDVAAPASPRVLGQVQGVGWVAGPDYCRGVVFVRAATPSDVQGMVHSEVMVAVDRKGRPGIEGRLDTAYHRGWVCGDGVAYGAEYLDAAVSVLDLSIPTRPRVASRLTGFSDAWSLAGDGRTVYVADGRGGLQILRSVR